MLQTNTIQAKTFVGPPEHNCTHDFPNTRLLSPKSAQSQLNLCRPKPFASSQTAALLQSLLALRPAAAHAPGLGALEVCGGDPALVEAACVRAAGDSRAVSADDGDLVGGVDFLGLAGGTLGALAALSTTALLGEEGGDPGVVDEVADAAEGGEEEEVEEDAVEILLLACVLLKPSYSLRAVLTFAGRTS